MKWWGVAEVNYQKVKTLRKKCGPAPPSTGYYGRFVGYDGKVARYLQMTKIGIVERLLAIEQAYTELAGSVVIRSGSALHPVSIPWFETENCRHLRLSRFDARPRCRPLLLQQERHQHSGSKQNYACNEKRPMERVHERLINRLV